jgi:hypothetical protein
MVMLERIDIKGHFFLPNYPDETLQGTLKFDQQNGIELDLFGSFTNFENTSSLETSIILGYTSKGRKLTLMNCYQNSASMSFPGFPHSNVKALYLLMNQHYLSMADIVFNNCSIEYEGLNYWLDITGFEKPKYNRENHEYSFKYIRPAVLKYELSHSWNAEITFDFYGPVEYYIPKGKFCLEQKAILKFLPTEYKPLRQFQNTFNIFTSFLAANYFANPLIKSISFREVTKKADELDSDYNDVELFFRQEINILKYKNHINHADFLIEYRDYKSDFQQKIAAWYSLYDKIDATINILTECFMDRSKPTELHFLSITQGIENMHRRCFHPKEMKFIDRFVEMLDYIPSKVKNALLENEVDFAIRIKDTRNYYTHYSDKAKQKASSLNEVYIMSEKLKVILLSAVLKAISFTDTQIETVVFLKGIYIFNHLIKIPK